MEPLMVATDVRDTDNTSTRRAKIMSRGYDNVKREGANVPGRVVLQEDRFPQEYRVNDAKLAEIYQWAVIAHLGGVGWTFKGCTETQEEAEAIAEFWRGHCAPTWVVPVELAWGSES